MPGPALFVVDHDESSLRVLLADLTRRFGNGFTVTGNSSPKAALAALQEAGSGNRPVALILVDGSSSDCLARVHELQPRAKRVLLVHRDYSSTSSAVQAMAAGSADYHIVRPWSNDEMLYGAMSEYLSSWTEGAVDRG
jgi:thioredoxin reductase (NADPH)